MITLSNMLFCYYRFSSDLSMQSGRPPLHTLKSGIHCNPSLHFQCIIVQVQCAHISGSSSDLSVQSDHVPMLPSHTKSWPIHCLPSLHFHCQSGQFKNWDFWLFLVLYDIKFVIKEKKCNTFLAVIDTWSLCIWILNGDCFYFGDEMKRTKLIKIEFDVRYSHSKKDEVN